MPSADQHRRKAEINRKFLGSISLSDFPDWVVVAAFYTAVHRVEQLRAAVGDGDSVSHDDRLAYVLECHRLIHTAYHVLQNVSMLARYESNATFFKQITENDIQERLIGKYLVHIEHYVQDKTVPPAKPE